MYNVYKGLAVDLFDTFVSALWPHGGYWTSVSRVLSVAPTAATYGWRCVLSIGWLDKLVFGSYMITPNDNMHRIFHFRVDEYWFMFHGCWVQRSNQTWILIVRSWR